MRSSTFPPAIVVPDTEDGHRYAHYESYPAGASVGFCESYTEDESPVFTHADIARPLMFPACGNRRHDGDRQKVWCFRCVAGFMAMTLDDCDRESHRDRCLLV